MDCVASVVADVLQGFGRAEGTLALGLDLKGAFNAVLLGVLLHQLSELGAPGFSPLAEVDDSSSTFAGRLHPFFSASA